MQCVTLDQPIQEVVRKVEQKKVRKIKHAEIGNFHR